MNIRISENIKKLRKQRGMTQERLAEVMGVTVGAVSKWESGLSTPEIGMIMELADFFRISVDVLLGYNLASAAMSEAVEEIRDLRNAKRFSEAAQAAEKAIERYPNSFDVAFQSAIMYNLMGIENGGDKAYRRALPLFERALELVGQNTNNQVNEWSLRNAIARTHLLMGHKDIGLEQLKRENVDGVNSGDIGQILASDAKTADEALEYLSEALIDHVSKLNGVITGYLNAYEWKCDYAAARDIITWFLGVISGLRLTDSISYIDKSTAQFSTALAVFEYMLGDEAAARCALMSAKEAARKFDSAPEYGFSSVRFFHGGKAAVGFDDFGKTAADGITKTLSDQGEYSEGLLKIWEELR